MILLLPVEKSVFSGHCFAAPDCFDLSGEEVHGYGKMLTSGHGVSVFLRDSKDCIYDLEVKAASCYEVRAAVPQTAACGKCTVYIMNDKSGVPVSFETEVYEQNYLDAVKNGSKVFNVLDYGAAVIRPVSKDYVKRHTFEKTPDSAPGFQRALDAAAEAGGGTVLFRGDVIIFTTQFIFRAE